jgi:hypothetical protein
MILSCFLPNVIGVVKSRRIRRTRHVARRGLKKNTGFWGNKGKAPPGRLKHGYEEYY